MYILFRVIIFALRYHLKLGCIARDCPLEVICKTMASLLMAKPFCHLFNVVLVASSVGRFREINVEAFWTLGAITISGASENDGGNIMLHRMKFRNIKVISVLPNICVNKVL
jgi:hypothetical protein